MKISVMILFAACAALVSPDLSASDGFVRVASDDAGRWWFVEPDGRRLVYSGMPAPTSNSHSSEALGVDRYRQNWQQKGDLAAWHKRTEGYLDKMGFNFMTGHPYIKDYFGRRYAVNLSLARDVGRLDPALSIIPFKTVHDPVFPNVFDPRFPEQCRKLAAERCAAYLQDHELIGYFIDNELLWVGRYSADRLALIDIILELPETHTARQALTAFLRERGVDPKAIDAATKTAFVALIAEKYFAITTAAIRAADPNHLVLGCRFAGLHSVLDCVWEAAGRYCDVVSVNVYPAADLDHGYVRVRRPDLRTSITDDFDRAWTKAKKPLIVTEWSFPALDGHGVGSICGAGQRHPTQASRAEATKLFARVMCSLPYLVGFIHFGWRDQPPFGSGGLLGEDANYGVVDVNDDLYPEIAAAFTEINGNLEAWHRAGPLPRKVRPPNALENLAARLALKGTAPGTVQRKKDGSLTIENGAFWLKGRVGARSGGLQTPFASLIPIVSCWEGGVRRWSDTGALESFSTREEKGVLTLETSFTNMLLNALSFRLRARIHIPAQSPNLIFEPVSVENLGTGTVTLTSVYCNFIPPKGSAYTLAPASLDRPIENLWGAPVYGAWINESFGGYFTGVVANSRDGALVAYRKASERLQCDSSLTLPEDFSLAPGAAYSFAERPCLILTVGRGGAWNWIRRVAELEAVQNAFLMEKAR